MPAAPAKAKPAGPGRSLRGWRTGALPWGLVGALGSPLESRVAPTKKCYPRIPHE
jgi:hypothetical protein